MPEVVNSISNFCEDAAYSADNVVSKASDVASRGTCVVSFLALFKVLQKFSFT